MLLDQTNNTAASPPNEPFLVQFPGTLPLEEVRAHQPNGLQAILDTIREEGNGFANIGKLRFMKSGKIVLRLQLPDSADFADLEINKGIDATFY